MKKPYVFYEYKKKKKRPKAINERSIYYENEKNFIRSTYDFYFSSVCIYYRLRQPGRGRLFAPCRRKPDRNSDRDGRKRNGGLGRKRNHYFKCESGDQH